MRLALDQDEIAPEQYSRPDRTYIDHALNRRLTADDRQAKRLCWALAMSDLKGCYDRIVHTAAAMALLRLGVSKATVFSMFSTIQRMVHRVRTAFGNSEGTYGGDEFDGWMNEPKGSYNVMQQDQQFGQPSARLFLRFYEERDTAIVFAQISLGMSSY